MVDARDMFINLRFQSITNLCLASVIITFQVIRRNLGKSLYFWHISCVLQIDCVVGYVPK